MARQVFTLCSSLAINCVLYQEAALINLWGAGIYYDGATCWDVNSSGVIIGTAVCTTTTSTTTTTTTAGLANVNITNNFFAGTIDDVQVNGISIVGANFPLGIGDGTIGTTNQIGTYSIVVFFGIASGVLLNSNIVCEDSDAISTCINMQNGGSVTFTSQNIDGNVDVNITGSDSSCI